MNHSMFLVSRRSLALLCVILAGVWVLSAALASGDQGGSIPRGAHGDATAEVQLQRLDKLLLSKDVAAPPSEYDPYIWEAFVPADNKMTAERVALGRKLYFDTRLSKDGTVSCATCHDVTRGFTDQRPDSEGIGGQLGRATRRRR